MDNHKPHCIFWDDETAYFSAKTILHPAYGGDSHGNR